MGILDEVEDVVRQCHPRPIVVAGDFNAHCTEWGCRHRQGDPRRGDAVIGWAAGLGLLLMNRYVLWALGPRAPPQVLDCRPRGEPGFPPPRWALSQLDADMFRAAALAATWHLDERAGEWETSPLEGARKLVGIVTSVCDVAIPRFHPRRRRAAYWWTAHIAELRKAAVRVRRESTWARRHDEEAVREREGYLQAREALKAAMVEAKKGAWEQLVNSLDEDPWGCPYKRTVGRIRPWAPPPTESMDPQDLEELLNTLFPRVEMCPPRIPIPEEEDWDEDLGVNPEEFARARKKLGAKDKAPGPDGISGRAWALALGEGSMPAAMRGMINGCLKEGVFPQEWRRAKLVLLPKASETPDGPPAYRPICLLDEAGKMMERIVADRLVQHMSSEGPDLHDRQYGFRPGRSTLDAVQYVRDLTHTVVEERGCRRILRYHQYLQHPALAGDWADARYCHEFVSSDELDLMWRAPQGVSRTQQHRSRWIWQPSGRSARYESTSQVKSRKESIASPITCNPLVIYDEIERVNFEHWHKLQINGSKTMAQSKHFIVEDVIRQPQN
ncbi:uncharacterized protein LOC112589131 [Harpegnathos saltator]|uniref:uncharacterized protein LOC112589131 n=1 Tax=Harpegnathos saltator TaxID=610380 RepID=UPI000DBEF21F|nr:uncharacterized protein LOC112589131 [Harpegnathos saltator]